jgi:predicted HAD superfamily Cof-like phosphohydrolase
MTNFVQDIIDFHKKFGLNYDGPPRELPDLLSEFRMKFMQEELDEYCEGEDMHDKEKMLDSLVDLLYVAFGTAHLHGFNIQAAWNRVHHANMQKVRAQRLEDSKRGSVAYDIVKPPNWKAPDLSDLV